MSNETSTSRDWRYPIEPQHIVEGPRSFNSDISLVRRMTWEAMSQVGITITFYRCSYDVSDFYQDPACSWDSGIPLNAIFEDNPKVKLLKDLGWYNEDEEIRAPIIYLPMYSNWVTKEILDVKANSLVEIHYFGQATPAKFRITERKMDSVYGCYYVCKLAPERMDNFELVLKEGLYYLKKDDTRPEVCADVVQAREDATVEGFEPDKRVYNHSAIDDYANTVMGDN